MRFQNMGALAAKDALIPLTLRYDRTYNERKPHRVFHNWGKSETQDAVAGHLAEELGLELIIADEQVAHARRLRSKMAAKLTFIWIRVLVSGDSRFNFHALQTIKQKIFLLSVASRQASYVAHQNSCQSDSIFPLYCSNI